jgi:hypothetical protein
MIRAPLISLAAGLALSGCVTSPTLPEWDTLPLASVEVQRPVALPPQPLAATSTDTTITFDEQGIRELEAFYLAAQGNQVIAQENVLALEAQSRAYNELLQAGEFQRQIAVIRQEQLVEERKRHWWDKIFLGGIIVLESLLML